MPLLMTLTGLLKISCQPSVLRISYLIYCGDFNINILNSHSHQPKNELINLMTSNSLYPLISKPTRITSSTATLIDDIFTNNLELKMNANLLYTDQGSKLKKSSGRLLATNWRNVVARCKFLVASLYI